MPPAVARTVNQTRLPTPIPTIRARVPEVVAVKDAVDAAPKMAAHDAMVIGFEAVAASEVRRAARGEMTSSSVSAPNRTLKADLNVFTPIQISTTAPANPRTNRKASILSSCAAPATPRQAYKKSTVAAPTPTAKPVGIPTLIDVRRHNKQTGTTCAATNRPRQRPTKRARSTGKECQRACPTGEPGP